MKKLMLLFLLVFNMSYIYANENADDEIRCDTDILYRLPISSYEVTTSNNDSIYLTEKKVKNNAIWVLELVLANDNGYEDDIGYSFMQIEFKDDKFRILKNALYDCEGNIISSFSKPDTFEPIFPNSVVDYIYHNYLKYKKTKK